MRRPEELDNLSLPLANQPEPDFDLDAFFTHWLCDDLPLLDAEQSLANDTNALIQELEALAVPAQQNNIDLLRLLPVIVISKQPKVLIRVKEIRETLLTVLSGDNLIDIFSPFLQWGSNISDSVNPAVKIDDKNPRAYARGIFPI